MGVDDVLAMRELTGVADDLDALARLPGACTVVLRPARLTVFRAALEDFVTSRDASDWLREADAHHLSATRRLLLPLADLCGEALRAALTPEAFGQAVAGRPRGRAGRRVRLRFAPDDPVPPRPRRQQGGAGHPLELFFDLVFVFAITQVSHLLLEHLTWEGLGQAVMSCSSSGGRGTTRRGSPTSSTRSPPPSGCC